MFLKPVLENGEMGNGKMKWEIEIANSFSIKAECRC